MGTKDIPACLNYILKRNVHSKKIIYFGHSQGGASILAGMSEMPEYYKNVLQAVVLLAPASRVDNVETGIVSLLKSAKLDEKLRAKDVYEILPHNHEFLEWNMYLTKYYPTIAFATLEMTSDEISWINCPDRIRVYFSHFPSGTSIKSLTHFKQLVEAKKFQKFDYREFDGGSEEPEEYDLSKIKEVKVILCAGKKDKLTHINDILWLKDQLQIGGNLFSFHSFDYMGHISFLLSNDITWFNFVLMDLYKILEMDSNGGIAQASTTEVSPENIRLEGKEIEKLFERKESEGVLEVKDK